MRAVFGIVSAAFLAGTLPASAEDLPALCRRGVQTPELPLDYVLQQEAARYHNLVQERMDPAAFETVATPTAEEAMSNALLAMAIEWPGVLSDMAGELPPAAHDLPWLIMLADVEAANPAPVEALVTSPLSITLPQLLPIMRRHGLAQEASLLREGMRLFPEWALNPYERQRLIAGYDGSAIDQGLLQALYEIEYRYPVEARAPAAAMALIDSQPALQAYFRSRVTNVDADRRLDHLIYALQQDCLPDMTYDASVQAINRLESAYLAMGSAQAALLMLDDLANGLDGSSAAMYLDLDAAVLAERLLRILDLRGETALADGLRKVLAEFPKPFPRDPNQRWELMEFFTPQQWERLDSAFPEDGYTQLRAVMLRLAQDSGLLAR